MDPSKEDENNVDAIKDASGQRHDNEFNQGEEDMGNDTGANRMTPMKPLCPATLKKHHVVRKKADLAYHKSAERMKRKHAQLHKVHAFHIGESVSLCIPRIDRSPTDVHRLPCVIVQVVGKAQSMYRLHCTSGVLDRCYCASDLEPFTSGYNIAVDGWKDDPHLSLRKAAQKQAPWNAFTGNKCNCRLGTCDSRRCHCKKMGVDCSSHCHRGEECKNKKYEGGNQEMTLQAQEGTYIQFAVLLRCLTLASVHQLYMTVFNDIYSIAGGLRHLQWSHSWGVCVSSFHQ